jgi:hypothetical protein
MQLLSDSPRNPEKKKRKKATTNLASKRNSLKTNATFCRLVVQRVKRTVSAFKYVNSSKVITTRTSVKEVLRLDSYRSSLGHTPEANFVAVIAFSFMSSK